MRFEMESVQERSGEEDEGNGTETEDLEDDSNKYTPRNSLHGKHSSSFDSPPRPPHSLDYPSLPHSLRLTSRQSSLVSSISSVDNGPCPLLSNQFSITSSITNLLWVVGGWVANHFHARRLVSAQVAVEWNQDGYQSKAAEHLWKSFEGKKEEFFNFLTMAEERLGGFQETLGQTMDMGAIQNEIETQKVCVVVIGTHISPKACRLHGVNEHMHAHSTCCIKLHHVHLILHTITLLMH